MTTPKRRGRAVSAGREYRAGAPRRTDRVVGRGSGAPSLTVWIRRRHTTVAELNVRIHSAPAKSLLRTRFATRRSTAEDIGPRRAFRRQIQVDAGVVEPHALAGAAIFYITGVVLDEVGSGRADGGRSRAGNERGWFRA